MSNEIAKEVDQLANQQPDVRVGRVMSAIFKKLVPSTGIAAGATLAMSRILHSNAVINLDTAAGSICTLPAATGSGAVYRFRISVIATTNSHIIKVANASDAMEGIVLQMSATNTMGGFAAVAGTSDTITLNRTTTGSVTVGENLEITDVAANRFSVKGTTSVTGIAATPFSATV